MLNTEMGRVADTNIAEELPIHDVWQDVQSSLSVVRYLENNQGKQNKVLIATGADPCAIKIPRHKLYDNEALLDREASVVALMQEASERQHIDLPVTVPHLLARSAIGLPWAAFSWVPGRVFTQEEMRQRFSPEEYCRLGQKIGEFVARFAQLVDVPTYKREIAAQHPFVFDRAVVLVDLMDRLDSFQARGRPLLAEVLDRLHQEYTALQREGRLTPRIVGHDDLRTDNLAFSVPKHSHPPARGQLEGIFDFGLTKLSTPEREFRFLYQYHPEAMQSAMHTWQELTGETIQLDLVEFWCKLHYLTAYARIIEQDLEVPEMFVRNIQRCYPEEDWQVELAQPTF